MILRVELVRALGLSALVLASACTFDEGANEARGCDETCAPGQCHLGYCLLTLAEAAAAVAPPAVPGSPQVSSGGAVASDPGVGSGGGASVASPPGGGVPGSGGAGPQSGGDCVPTAETCNGLDDDCNGQVDDDTEVACYPSGMVGCATRSDGGFDCRGACKAGVQTCHAGVLSACSEHVGPVAELCDAAEAADDDCDGAVDDGCACTGTETQRCYDGPAFTAGIGRCRSGTQTCEGGQFGECVGAITPVPESCTNQGADDDCDFFPDDISGLGAFCTVLANQGVCRNGQRGCRNGALTCLTPAALPTENACDGRDEDCDGDIDEVFDLATDENNCGLCGVRCAAGDLCCGGVCRDVDADALHCGACGNPCVGGTSCCGGSCVPTNTELHCGGCNPCPGGEACCGNACVPTNTELHCGGCNPCPSGEACCGNACVNTQSSDQHCGGCGAGCDASCMCVAGDCQDTTTGMACP